MEKVKIVIQETKNGLRVKTHGKPIRVLAALTTALAATTKECKKFERTNEVATRIEEVAKMQFEQAFKEFENAQQ